MTPAQVRLLLTLAEVVKELGWGASMLPGGMEALVAARSAVQRELDVPQENR